MDHFDVPRAPTAPEIMAACETLLRAGHPESLAILMRLLGVRHKLSAPTREARDA